MLIKNIEKQHMEHSSLTTWIFKTAQDEGISTEYPFVYCPHCNGYGSSLKDPENTIKCSFCGGGGKVTEAVAKKYYESLEESPKKRKEGLRRYYLKRSHQFQTKPYSIGTFAIAIESAGGVRVAIEDIEGIGEQKNVIAFNATPETLVRIEKALNSLDAFKDRKCIIYEKN